MTTLQQVRAPAGFVPEHAIAFVATDGAAITVAQATPLPMQAIVTAADSAPLAGTTAASGSLGPFVPALGRAIWVSLSGTWAGGVQLLRSTDGGATRLPITYADGSARGVWSGNVNAAVTEESVAGATYYLAVTLSSGTLAYQVRQ